MRLTGRTPKLPGRCTTAVAPATCSKWLGSVTTTKSARDLGMLGSAGLFSFATTQMRGCADEEARRTPHARRPKIRRSMLMLGLRFLMTRSIFLPICFGNPMQLTASALSACLLISAGARSGRHQTRLAAIAAAPPSEEFNSFAVFIKKQQDALVAALEATDGSATFERDPWRREDGTGEGCM